MKLPNLQNLNIERGLAGLVADLKARRLLPAVVVIVVALVAIPVLLSRGASPAALPALPVTTQASVQPVVHPVSHHTAGPNFLRGPAHDPFVAPPAVKSATPAKSSASTSKATTSNTTAPAHHATAPVQDHATTVSTKRTAATREYTTYRPQLGFGRRGGKLTTHNGLDRFGVLSGDGSAVLLYLGLEHNAKTAVFLVPTATTVSGGGECSPSAQQCRYLTLRPGEHVLLTSQPQGKSATEYTLNYRSVRKTRTRHKVQRGVDAYGQAVVSWAAGFLAPLKSLHFATATGLLTIHLPSLVAAALTPQITGLAETTTTGSTNTGPTSTTG